MVMPGLERTIVAFETLTVNTAIGPTAATARNCTYALFGPVETDQVRWRADGTAPTASVGHLMQIGQTLELYGAAVATIQFIKVTNNAAVPVSYYR